MEVSHRLVQQAGEVDPGPLDRILQPETKRSNQVKPQHVVATSRYLNQAGTYLPFFRLLRWPPVNDGPASFSTQAGPLKRNRYGL